MYCFNFYRWNQLKLIPLVCRLRIYRTPTVNLPSADTSDAMSRANTRHATSKTLPYLWFIFLCATYIANDDGGRGLMMSLISKQKGQIDIQ